MEITNIANGGTIFEMLRAHAGWLDAELQGESAEGRCILDNATLNGMNLTDADLQGAIIRGSTLLDAELSGSEVS